MSNGSEDQEKVNLNAELAREKNDTGNLKQQLEAAEKRIDELVIIIHNLAQTMQTNGYNLLGTGYDMQTLGRIINERFPLTGPQQDLVNKSKKQSEQSVNNQ